jgi:hypothetical protein
MKLTWAQFSALSSSQKTEKIDSMANYLKEVLKESYAKYELYLSASDMYGDPYNF